MLFTLWLWILLGGGAFVGFFTWMYYALELDEGARERKLKKLGRKNARLLEAHQERSCFYCGKIVDPDWGTKGCYKDGIGWYHSDCYLKLLDE